MITLMILLRSFILSSLLLTSTQKCSRNMVIFFFDSFLFNSTVGLFRLGSKSQLVDLFTNFFHMIDLSFVSTTVFESTTSEFI
jgi:hypothetical protein